MIPPNPATSAAPPIRVLIVDDHFMARIGLALPINQQADMEVVAEARNVQEAITLYRQHLPDVVTMDYELPDGVGPEAVVRIRTEFPGARILLLSAYEGEEQVHRAVEAGVCGYLPKSSECSTVLNAIRDLHGGRSVFPADILRKAVSRSHREPLSDREIKILTLLSRGNSNKLIAAELGYSESLIKKELIRIFSKLGAKDRAHAVMLALDRGLVSTV